MATASTMVVEVMAEEVAAAMAMAAAAVTAASVLPPLAADRGLVVAPLAAAPR